MKPSDLENELAKLLPPQLAADLVRDFVSLALEVRASALERVSSGKFIESVVQCLQFLSLGKFDSKPEVDAYLKSLDSKPAPIHDDLRLTLQRIARAAYTIRNKRNVAHKGEVDPNIYDLRFLFAAAQWILTELVRHAAQIDVATAGKLIEFVQIPASSIVDNVGEVRIIHGVSKVDDEILVLMNSFHPSPITWTRVSESLSRRSSSTVAGSLVRLHKLKLIQKDKSKVYRLTSAGYSKAQEIIKTIGL